MGNVVHADVLEDHEGRSKGCGIVEYDNPHGAMRAIRELNNTDLKGRLIFVREDREDKKVREERFFHPSTHPDRMIEEEKAVRMRYCRLRVG